LVRTGKRPVSDRRNNKVSLSMTIFTEKSFKIKQYVLTWIEKSVQEFQRITRKYD